MSIAFWIMIALVCVVLPSVALTGGGTKTPQQKPLAKHVEETGLLLTEAVTAPVLERIRRRERGMLVGGIVAIALSTLTAMVLDTTEVWGPLIFIFAMAGMGFGGAWAMSAHRPPADSAAPLVARMRSTRFADYLTKGERIGLYAAPAVLLLGVPAGLLLFLHLPETARGASISLGLVGTAVALATWLVAMAMLHRLLDSPARSGSDLELAWDDAERAVGLRQVVNLVVAVACFALSYWVLLMAESLTTSGFYREPGNSTLTYGLTAATTLVFGALILTAVTGPMLAWLTGERRGYEQRQLWPQGVRAQ